jgi:hypothetical protein
VRRELSNATPFAAIAHPLVEPSGRQVVVVIVKGTFEARRGAIVRAEPRPVRLNDVPHDDKTTWSSLRYPSDFCPQKGGADVIVIGDAISPRPVIAMDVAVKVRDLTAPLRVHGPRVYYASVGQVVIGPAAAVERVPIVYEKAYGGVIAQPQRIEDRNPSGVGFAARPADLVGQPAPQIEHPAHPLKSATDRPDPAGYGPIASYWSPRRERAGTFDDRWKQERFPLMPLDFDVRYNNSANRSLLLGEPLRPGDPVGVMGMSTEGVWSFVVPRLPVLFHARFDGGRAVRLAPVIDTLLLEPGEQRLEIVARQVFPVGRGREVLRELRVDLDDG